MIFFIINNFISYCNIGTTLYRVLPPLLLFNTIVALARRVVTIKKILFFINITYYYYFYYYLFYSCIIFFSSSRVPLSSSFFLLYIVCAVRLPCLAAKKLTWGSHVQDSGRSHSQVYRVKGKLLGIYRLTCIQYRETHERNTSGTGRICRPGKQQ